MHRVDRIFWRSFFTYLACFTAAVVLTFCTPAPAAAVPSDTPTVEFYGANDVGGAIFFLADEGACKENGGKMAISLSKAAELLWVGCWRDAGGSIQLVWITEQGPRPYLIPKTSLRKGPLNADPLSGGTKL